MHALVERTVGICRATFERSIVIDVSRAGAPLAVIGEAGALEQMLLNILLNARDALESVPKPDRAIRIGLGFLRSADAAGRVTDWVRVRISDNGSGMTEEVRGRIFEPFFTTKGVGMGSGLGLATAYAIVTDHGGRLSCESRIGVGTTFSVLLPATRDLPQPASIPERRNWAGKETILVIDDERLVRRAVRSVLEPHGYEVREAADGSSGLEVFQRERARIDLVLLDLSMPGIPGEAVLSTLLREQPTTRVVLFTGYQPPTTPRGAAAVLQKPFELEELLRVVRAVCDGATMTRTGLT
jgi:CheY-like chemotaxis protein